MWRKSLHFPVLYSSLVRSKEGYKVFIFKFDFGRPKLIYRSKFLLTNNNKDNEQRLKKNNSKKWERLLGQFFEKGNIIWNSYTSSPPPWYSKSKSFLQLFRMCCLTVYGCFIRIKKVKGLSIHHTLMHHRSYFLYILLFCITSNNVLL